MVSLLFNFYGLFSKYSFSGFWLVLCFLSDRDFYSRKNLWINGHCEWSAQWLYGENARHRMEAA